MTAYDCAISNYLGTHTGADDGPLGETFSLSMKREQGLRYGENPHQTGALYGNFLKIAEQLHGKELSYNNVIDISSAINLMIEFQNEPKAVVAILKHNTPCGVGIGDTLKAAWDKAFATDPDSPFGGIIIANRPWDLEFARAVDELFTEVLIGPDYPRRGARISAQEKKSSRDAVSSRCDPIARNSISSACSAAYWCKLPTSRSKILARPKSSPGAHRPTRRFARWDSA